MKESFYLDKPTKGLDNNFKKIKEYFRNIKKTKNNEIYSENIINNKYYDNYDNSWKSFELVNNKWNTNVIDNLYLKMLNKLLKLKKQYNEQKIIFSNNKEKSFYSYLDNVNIINNIIIKPELKWFKNLNIIEENEKNNKTFTITNNDKLIAWADKNIEFFTNKIRREYDQNSFLSATLILDSASPYIIFSFIGLSHSFNENIGKFEYVFNSKDTFIEYDPDLKNINKEYNEFINKKLFNELHWNKKYRLYTYANKTKESQLRQLS